MFILLIFCVFGSISANSYRRTGFTGLRSVNPEENCKVECLEKECLWSETDANDQGASDFFVYGFNHYLDKTGRRPQDTDIRHKNTRKTLSGKVYRYEVEFDHQECPPIGPSIFVVDVVKEVECKHIPPISCTIVVGKDFFGQIHSCHNCTDCRSFSGQS